MATFGVLVPIRVIVAFSVLTGPPWHGRCRRSCNSPGGCPCTSRGTTTCRRSCSSRSTCICLCRSPQWPKSASTCLLVPCSLDFVVSSLPFSQEELHDRLHLLGLTPPLLLDCSCSGCGLIASTVRWTSAKKACTKSLAT